LFKENREKLKKGGRKKIIFEWPCKSVIWKRQGKGNFNLERKGVTVGIKG